MGAKILKFYVSSTDVVNHESVYETIAFSARRYGLAGATVYKGVMGYGSSSSLHSDKFWELNNKVPVIVEFVDEEDKINGFLAEILPFINSLPKGCLITKEDIYIVLKKQGIKK